MVSFVSSGNEAIRYTTSFRKNLAGAESNTAIGLAKLGKKVSWISKLGEDEFGAYILRELRAENVDVSHVTSSASHPTGIMFKQQVSQEATSVFYYRAGSAASTLTSADLPLEEIRKAKILYLTGITPALSSNCRALIFELIDFAKKEELLIAFDPNIRLKLWSKDEAKICLNQIMAKSDLVFIGDEEAKLLLGTGEPQEIAQLLFERGVKKVAIKLGGKGAFVADETGGHFVHALKTTVVDSIGAGDAFNAGFIYGLLEGVGLEECGRIGSILGAKAVSVKGDVEGLPELKQLQNILHQNNEIYR